MVGKLTACDFARLNNISIADIETFSESRTGAYFLNENTELTVYEFSDGFITITRNDNIMNDIIAVIVGRGENWKYKEDGKK